ncbi:MAG: hypothetical protein AB7N76_08120 [Planctomycetota bacterium]
MAKRKVPGKRRRDDDDDDESPPGAVGGPVEDAQPKKKTRGLGKKKTAGKLGKKGQSKGSDEDEDEDEEDGEGPRKKRSDHFKERRDEALTKPEKKVEVPRFSSWAIGVLAIGGVVAAAAAVMALGTPGHVPGHLFAVGGIAGLFALGGGYKLGQEALIPTLPAHTPQEAFEVFLKALKAQRWDLAHAALSWVAHEPTDRPALREAGIGPGRADLRTPEGLGSLWTPLVASKSEGLTTTDRSWGYKLSGERQVDDDLVTTIVVLRLQITERIGHRVTSVRTFTYTGTLVAHDRGGAWRLLYGGLPLYGRLMGG